jgi:hypothetical protein
MKVMSGQQNLNNGNVIVQKGIQIAYLPQEVPIDITGTVFDIVLSGLGKRAELLSQYHHLLHRLQTDQSSEVLNQLDTLQNKLDYTDSWDLDKQVEDIIANMKLDPDSDFAIRNDVLSLRTVAVNLYHHVSPISRSLNPIEVADKIKNIPQQHFIGGRDKVIPAFIARSFVTRQRYKDFERVTVVDDATHVKGRKIKWRGLLLMPII